MKPKQYGYIRVSTIEQNHARQSIELEKFGIAPQCIYIDKCSGKDFKRPAYQRLRRRLRKGDLLVVKSLDRLGRNYEEIQNEWRYFTKTVQIDIVVLDMPLLDTREHKDLLGTVISDIVLQLISYVAQSEREQIRQRQAEGIAAARARGQHLGRPTTPNPPNFEAIYSAYRRGALTRKEAAKQLHVSASQFTWLLRRARLQEEQSNGASAQHS